jgi:arylsulfatase A-like enzyme
MTDRPSPRPRDRPASGAAAGALAARRGVSSLLLVLALAGCGGDQAAPETGAAAAAARRASPPRGALSLLLIVSDTLRADALECYGGAARTPHLCSLARRGVLFERAYSNAPWTLPSVVSMMSGNPSSQYALPAGTGRRAIRFRIPDQEVLLAEALAERGYDRASILENPLAGDSNTRQGFAARLPAARSAAQVDARLGFHDRTRRYLKLEPLLRYLMGSPQHPFFILHWFNDPHAWYSPPPRFLEPLRAEAARLPRPLEYYLRLGHPHRPRRGERNLRRELAGLSAAELAFLRRLYLAEVESVDERVGYLLRALELSGRDRDTLVVVTSDHGEGFGEHGSYLHGETFYDELLHVPLLMAGPGVSSGLRVDTPVSHLDLMPTLADLLGVRCLESPAGQSLAPLLRGELTAALRDRDLYVVSPLRDEETDALIAGRYKLIAAQEDRALELYDLIADAGETRNLAAARPDVATAMLRRLRQWRKLNEERRQQTLARTGVPSPAEEDETLQQLKALGYVE